MSQAYGLLTRHVSCLPCPAPHLAPVLLQYYQQYVQLIIERTNTVNGRVYKDDPTIW